MGLDALLERVPFGVRILRATGPDPSDLEIEFENDAARRTGGLTDDRLAQLVHDCCVEQKSGEVERDAATADRPYQWLREQITPIGGSRVLVIDEDVTEQRIRERALRRSARMHRLILDRLKDGVVVVDTDRRIVQVNHALLALWPEDVTGARLEDIAATAYHEDGRPAPWSDWPAARALLGEDVHDQILRFEYSADVSVWVECSATPLIDEVTGELEGAVATFSDVTDRVERERRARHEADHDHLTGLANRRLLERTLDATIARAEAADRGVALLLVDLDGFKDVNDQYGHRAGDIVLITIATRLRGNLRERDLVARYGGDEFVIVLPDLSHAADVAESFAGRVAVALGSPIRVEDVDVDVRASIGVAVYPRDGRTRAELIERSDREMYVAKSRTR